MPKKTLASKQNLTHSKKNVKGREFAEIAVGVKEFEKVLKGS
jgi:hypothetical protein